MWNFDAGYNVILVVTLSMNPVWVPGGTASLAYGVHLALQVLPVSQGMPGYRIRSGDVTLEIYREASPPMVTGTSIDIPIHLVTIGG